MIRIIASLAALAASLQAAPTIPQPPHGRALEYESAGRAFYHAGDFEPMGEYLQRWQYQGQRLYKSLTVGSYARVEKHLKIGAFYRLQYGARHDDDWVSDAFKRWNWQDTTGRPESLLVLDATPRAELPFLPGRTWVGSVKTRYEHDFYNGHSAVSVGPELAWFWMNGLSPRATVFLRDETVFALNFGQRRVWQRWHYLAGLWHTAHVSFGPSIALRDEVWSTSAAYKAKRTDSYQTLYRAWILGVSAVARFP